MLVYLKILSKILDHFEHHLSFISYQILKNTHFYFSNSGTNISSIFVKFWELNVLALQNIESKYMFLNVSISIFP